MVTLNDVSCQGTATRREMTRSSGAVPDTIDTRAGSDGVGGIGATSIIQVYGRYVKMSCRLGPAPRSHELTTRIVPLAANTRIRTFEALSGMY